MVGAKHEHSTSAGILGLVECLLSAMMSRRVSRLRSPSTSPVVSSTGVLVVCSAGARSGLRG